MKNSELEKLSQGMWLVCNKTLYMLDDKVKKTPVFKKGKHYKIHRVGIGKDSDHYEGDISIIDERNIEHWLASWTKHFSTVKKLKCIKSCKPWLTKGKTYNVDAIHDLYVGVTKDDKGENHLFHAIAFFPLKDFLIKKT